MIWRKRNSTRQQLKDGDGDVGFVQSACNHVDKLEILYERHGLANISRLYNKREC
jgi:hypothetical protein